MEETSNESVGGTVKGKFQFLLLLIASVLLPVFLLPSPFLNLTFSKFVFFSFCVFVAFVLWQVNCLRRGEFEFSGNSIVYAGGIVLLTSLLSTIFSGAFSQSFIGSGFDTGSWFFLAVAFLSLFLVAHFFQSKDRIFYTYLGFFAVFFVVSIFHLLRLFFGPDFLSFGLFVDQTSNVVGKWNDLAVFFGMAVILSLATLELIRLKGVLRVLTYLALVFGLFFLAVINFATVWAVLGFLSTAFLVFLLSISWSRPSGEGEPSTDGTSRNMLQRLPRATFAVMVISIFFAFAGSSPIGTYLPKQLGIFSLEAKPGWLSTLSIAKETLFDDPIFGAGPNRFNSEWFVHKDPGVNSTIFWATDFNYGVGYVPTFIVTTGLLGSLSWLLFLLAILYTGFRVMFSKVVDSASKYLVIASLFGTIFLWGTSIFYVPGLAMTLLAFVFTGLFIASASEAGLLKTKNFTFSDNSKTSFVSVLLIIVIFILTAGGLYYLSGKYVSYAYMQKGVLVANSSGDIEKADYYLNKAISVSADDLYYRLIAEINIAKLGALLSRPSGSMTNDELTTKLQNILGVAVEAAKMATKIDDTNYENWVSLGRVYESVVPLKISGAYENAFASYGQAINLNPSNPSLYLTLSRLEFTKGANDKAEDYVMQAIRMKNNYTEAIFLLSQIQAKEGKTKEAILSVEAATMLSPKDQFLFFQLGLLRFNDKDYKGAVVALEKALELNKEYANAKYFLGLSYDKLGRRADAIEIFTELKKSNPDSKEVALILSNLKSGRAPFSDATPPIDDRPEKRQKLPVEEKSAVN